MSITSVKKRTHYEVDMTNGNVYRYFTVVV